MAESGGQNESGGGGGVNVGGGDKIEQIIGFFNGYKVFKNTLDFQHFQCIDEFRVL